MHQSYPDILDAITGEIREAHDTWQDDRDLTDSERVEAP